jgi:hypothetical protein
MASFGLRHLLAGSPQRQAESSSSLSYGLAIHLPLLSTLPRGNAVTVGYMVQTQTSTRTSTSLIQSTYKRTSRLAPRAVAVLSPES